MRRGAAVRLTDIDLDILVVRSSIVLINTCFYVHTGLCYIWHLLDDTAWRRWMEGTNAAAGAATRATEAEIMIAADFIFPFLSSPPFPIESVCTRSDISWFGHMSERYRERERATRKKHHVWKKKKREYVEAKGQEDCSCVCVVYAVKRTAALSLYYKLICTKILQITATESLLETEDADNCQLGNTAQRGGGMYPSYRWNSYSFSGGLALPHFQTNYTHPKLGIVHVLSFRVHENRQKLCDLQLTAKPHSLTRMKMTT